MPILEMTSQYTIGRRDDQSYITCHVCGMTSWNPHDIANHYCPGCNTFHWRALQEEERRGRLVGSVVIGLGLLLIAAAIYFMVIAR